MIQNLYIISEGGIAVYSKNYAKSTLDEQLISGFLLATGNFAKETVGSGLKKIEMQKGEQLCIFYDESLKLSVAAIVGAEDHPKLVSEILQDILRKYGEMFKDKIGSPSISEESPKFDPIVDKILADRTAKRDKKRFILGLLLGGLILGTLLLFLFIPYLKEAVITFISQIISLYGGGPHTYLDAILFFGEFSLKLEITLLLAFIPSSFIAGYLAGSRSKGKVIGLIFFFFALGLSFIAIFIDVISILIVFMLLIYIPLVLITSIVLGYLGGLLRDRRVLYPIALDKN